MRPSRSFLWLLGGWLALALPLAVLRLADSTPVAESWSGLWWLAGILAGLLAVVDALRCRHLKQLHVSRTMSSTLAVGVWQPVDVRVKNTSGRQLSVLLTDQWPPGTQMNGLPAAIEVQAGETVTVRYQLRPGERGNQTSGLVDMRIRSPLSFWDMRRQAGQPSQVRVYPDFAPVFNSQALSLEQQINKLGVHRHQLRGEGMDFRQLREFREGDILRQVDWKASSRMQKLISREYQQERDQEVIFAIDCGRRMRARDGQLSHFDHALNAMLLTSWIALRQGDAVGFQSFATEKDGDKRWLAPGKGQIMVNRILQQSYDLQSSVSNSDFLKAAEAVLARHQKRACIVLVTNIREEDSDDLLAAVRLLSARHMVMIASLCEQVLDRNVQQPVASLEQALVYSGTRSYLDKRQAMIRELRRAGVVVVDSRPDTLHVDMVSQYLQLKSSARL